MAGSAMLVFMDMPVITLSCPLAKVLQYFLSELTHVVTVTCF